ncbi:MAG: DUF4194 domain-containing protein [Synergistaceae bacterium]|nr:DUF4194 domain-containing protein [Synergistaceae bacterium]
MSIPERAAFADVDNDRGRRFSRLLITLYKGVLYKERDEALWRDLGEFTGMVIDHFAPLGLRLVKDDNEGYAYVAYPPEGEAADSEEEPLPRLVAKRQLSFGVSLMLALLRKRMAEFDTAGEGTRLIVSRGEIVEIMRPFMPESTNEAKLADKIDTALNKVKELGFIRQLRNNAAHYEVLRILKAYVDAKWLADFDSRLEAYKGYGRSGAGE